MLLPFSLGVPEGLGLAVALKCGSGDLDVNLSFAASLCDRGQVTNPLCFPLG